MATFQTVTLNMVAGNGYVVTLASPAGIANLLARAACYVQAVGPGKAPAAPSVSPAPSVGTSSAWVDMQAGEAQSFGVDSSFSATGPTLQDQIGYLVVWAVGSGNLVVNAH